MGIFFHNKFILILWTLNAVASAKVPTGCSIKLNEDIKGFAPVILTAAKRKYYQLFRPTGEVTRLKTGTRLLLACTGHKNVFTDTNFHMLQLKCLKGNFVDANNNEQALSKLTCKSIPTSTLRLTADKCARGKGLIYESGFMLENDFYGPIFEICHNTTTDQTIYTHHILNGAAIKYSISESTRRAFTGDGMQLKTTKLNNLYKKENQIKRFEKLFGSTQTYLNSKNFLARGHLTPDADFILPYEQLSTYYYANVAPQFQVVNAGNWLRVEALARDVAAAYQDDIESYNSYMGVLSLPNVNGESVDICLDEVGTIKAPRFYFKILLHRASDSAIVFVSANNPYINEGKEVEICTNVCKESGLEHAHFPDVTKGYTFCCELKEFKRLVKTLPTDLKASKLLKRKK